MRVGYRERYKSENVELTTNHQFHIDDLLMSISSDTQCEAMSQGTPPLQTWLRLLFIFRIVNYQLLLPGTLLLLKCNNKI